MTKKQQKEFFTLVHEVRELQRSIVLERSFKNEATAIDRLTDLESKLDTELSKLRYDLRSIKNPLSEPKEESEPDGICSHCGQGSKIVNLKLNLCRTCGELKQYRPKVKKTQYIKHFSEKKKKANKEKLEMYDKLPDIKFCESCGSTQHPISRSHIISVAMRNDLEADAENIVFECYGGSARCHEVWDDGTPEQRLKQLTIHRKIEYMIKEGAYKTLINKVFPTESINLKYGSRQNDTDNSEMPKGESNS